MEYLTKRLVENELALRAKRRAEPLVDAFASPQRVEPEAKRFSPEGLTKG